MMRFVHENLMVLIVLAAGISAPAFAKFCHWQEKRQDAKVRRYYERYCTQWRPRT
jgi:hypothetical protein